MRPPMGPPMGGGRPRGPMGGPPGPGGPGRRMIPGEKPKDFKGTFRQLLRYLSRFKWIIAVVVLFAVASTVFSAAASVSADIRLVTTSEVDISILVTESDRQAAFDAICSAFAD